MTYTIYKTDTGEIRRTSELVDTNQGEAAIEGSFSSDTHYVKAGVAIEIPPKPYESAKFDYILERWVSVLGMDVRPITHKRQKLLQESDWTQMPDVTHPKKTEWAVYRQAIRDIPEQTGYPLNIIWPIPPESA